MKNTSYFRTFALGTLLVSSLSATAQGTLVTDTKTDVLYANTTQVFKSEKATDSQILAEIDGNFGIGDVVRIAVAPPPSKTLPPTQIATPKQTINSKTPNLVMVSTPTQQGTTTTVSTSSNAAPNVVKAAEPQRVTTPTQQKRTIVYIELGTKPNVVKAAESQRVTTSVNTPTNATPNVVKTAEPQGVTTPSEQKTTLANIETPPSVNEANNVDKNTERASTQNNERQMERKSTKSDRSSSSVKSKSSGKSSRKSSFSLFKNWSFKTTKSAKYKGGSKFGCYRF
jgi:hypothetical protein